MDKSFPDSGNVFERLHLAMEDFCLNANLRQRLSAVRSRLLLFRVEDFPEHMRERFRQLMEDLPKSNQEYFRDAERVPIAKALLSLYTTAACDRLLHDALPADLAGAVEPLHRVERELAPHIPTFSASWAAFSLTLPEEERTAWAFRLEKERLARTMTIVAPEGTSVSDLESAMQSTGVAAEELEMSIATLAHQLWQSRGCPIGSPEVDWFQAEQELKVKGEPESVSA